MFQVYPQSIHMKNQALFSSKVKSKKLKCCLLQFLIVALWVKFKETRQNILANKRAMGALVPSLEYHMNQEYSSYLTLFNGMKRSEQFWLLHCCFTSTVNI